MPTPPQTLDTHTAIFARMGFSPQEMISMVACGHTIGEFFFDLKLHCRSSMELGGVAPQDFPDVIPSSAGANADGVVPFDSSEDVFDNRV
jgi:catalase (peroxidase I)